MNVLNCAQVRELDRLAIEQYGLPGIVLMENAGRGVVETMTALGIDGPVVICLGKGNNAGDGLVMARHLDLLGCETLLFAWNDPHQWQGDTAINRDIVQASGLQLYKLNESADDRFERALDEAAWVVDAILGTGATGAPRAPYDAVIRLANDCPARRLAVDLPSGLDADTGAASAPTFEADHTCTFVAPKPGLLAKPAAHYVGELHVIDIGLPRKLLHSFD